LTLVAGEPKDAGSTYGPLLAGLLTEETTRRASIEQRALGVISTSGGLITLVLALQALLLGKDPTPLLPAATKVLLTLAITAFAAASVAALMANRPKRYLGFSAEDLDRMVDEWSYDAEDARLLVAQMRADQCKRALALNNRKAQLVQHAIGLAVLGVLLVAASVVVAVLAS
jgi:hypothetical protein